MSTAVPQLEARIVLSTISWATYEALVTESDSPGKRIVYDHGILEIMSPSAAHERYHRLLGRLIETFTLERNIPIHSDGATTLKSRLKQCGLEPDESYHIANESLVRGRKDLDLTIDPPPDLAIEIDISPSVTDKLAIYAALRVPEVWFYDGDSLHVHVLQHDGTFTKTLGSSQFPELTIPILDEFLSRWHETDETTWIRSFQQWVHEVPFTSSIHRCSMADET